MHLIIACYEFKRNLDTENHASNSVSQTLRSFADPVVASSLSTCGDGLCVFSNSTADIPFSGAYGLCLTFSRRNWEPGSSLGVGCWGMQIAMCTDNTTWRRSNNSGDAQTAWTAVQLHGCIRCEVIRIPESVHQHPENEELKAKNAELESRIVAIEKELGL